MKPYHLVMSMALAAILGFVSTIVMAQPKPYYGPLLYSMLRDTSVPPVYSGQPSQVTEGYLWLDDAMRLYPEYKIDSFMNTLSWGDSMKTIASVFYQAQDDNPLSFYMWSGKAMHPNPYKGDPGRAMVAFQKRVTEIAGDTGRTASLLTADIIADVLVTDTFVVTEPDPYVTFNMVSVNSTIIDEIKGKMVPLCVGENMRARQKGTTPQSVGTAAWATYPVPADSGGCIQFEYSPQWFQAGFWGSDEGAKLRWWVKPGYGYIVLLTFDGIGYDSTHGYFTLNPGPASLSEGGMYPVINGIVQDPNDDYGLGGTNLTVADWKARLRARINNIINP